MCGITGFFGKSEVNISTYYSAHKALDHRGPDDEGFFICSNSGFIESFGDKSIPEKRNSVSIHSIESSKFCLGHHRLKIVDLSPGGHQPMQTSNGRYHIVYNGEVYNYVELRTELISLGHKFITTSDTEVVLAAFSQWKEACFNKFNGMWALVVYDSQEELLYFSRDRFGIKPLYYYHLNETVYFASELKFFKKLGLPLTLNRKTAANYLAYCFIDSDNETFFNEVLAIPAAHWVIFNQNGKFIKKGRYWTLQHSVNNDITFEAAVDKMKNLFHSSLELRMRSDVPVGTLLSGGLDSTSIVCNLAKYFSLPKDKIETFSAVFNETEYSEKNYIDKTVKLNPQISPHFVIPSPEIFKDEINELIESIETPIRSMAAFSQYKIYELVKNKTDIVVLLNGQGADELFAGYRAHYSFYFSELLKKGDFKELKNEISYFKKTRPSELNATVSVFIKSLIPRLFKKIKSHITANNIFKDATQSIDAFNLNSTLKDSLAFDLQVSALPEYLHYEDRNSMRFSKEARLPFLDYRIVEFAFSLPSKFKIKNGVNKLILREAVKDYITPEVLDRKDKMGFISPQDLWQKTVLHKFITETLLTPDSSGLYTAADVKYLLEENDKDPGTSHQEILWRIFSFKIWYKLFVTNAKKE